MWVKKHQYGVKICYYSKIIKKKMTEIVIFSWLLAFVIIAYVCIKRNKAK